MSTAALKQPASHGSPRFKARAAGLLWLINAVAGTLMWISPGTMLILVAGVSYIGVAVFVYLLLKPVNRRLSLLSGLFGIAGAVLGTLHNLFSWGPESAQFVLFGLHTGSVGYLILRSIFLPRLVGLLIVASGLGWLTFSLSNLLLGPETTGSLAPYAMGIGILGELVLLLWLLVFGVNERRWRDQEEGRRGRSDGRASPPSILTPPRKS